MPSTFATTRAAAQDQPLNAAALFLLFPVGATTVGMGQTAAAADGHGEAVFQNPAGVATLSSSEFALHTATLAAGPTNALTAFFPRRGIGVFGATLYLADYGDLELTDSSGTTNGRLSSRNFAFLATYATQLTGSVSLGVSYKLVQFAVTCSGACQSVPAGQGVTHALDVGGQFAVGADHALRIGVALRNLGFPLQVNNRDQADPLPTRLTVGATYRVQLRPADDSVADRFDLRMAADVESPWRQTGNPDIRLGVDVGYREMVRVRGGYAFVHQGLSGPSIGLGVATGAIGVDLARMFLTGTDLVTPNPTFLSFRVEF
ncbi:MAG TPA: PorV/PorQ family protein [Gemmatimonadales bacterium]|nr:PorV/PorQ family protein [Gemmatimonadales bacterium]